MPIPFCPPLLAVALISSAFQPPSQVPGSPPTASQTQTQTQTESSTQKNTGRTPSLQSNTPQSELQSPANDFNKTPEIKKTRNDDPEQSGVLRVLPEGMDENPPVKADLDLHNQTWKGEYEASKDGKPVLGPDARPIPVLYNKKGKRIKSNIKPLKTHPLKVVNGILTVDGWTGKARLNYDIPEQSFLYFSSPQLGTVIISQAPFPGSREQKVAFTGKSLLVHVTDHDVELTSEQDFTGKKAESAWVLVDPDFRADTRYPQMGYGSASHRPYAWPTAKQWDGKGSVNAPPLPASLVQQFPAKVCIPQPKSPCSTTGSAAHTTSKVVPATTAFSAPHAGS